MDLNRKKELFPSYFKNFDYEIPSVAVEQEIQVYRACHTHKIEKASFLNTYEENGFRVSAGGDIRDPQEYCLSTYTRVKDLKRFVAVDSKHQPPWLLAKGHTTVTDGLSCITKEWKKIKGSHVDWWLYKNAEPWLAFEEINYEEEDAAVSEKK